MIQIDKPNRQIIVTNDRTRDRKIIKEFEKIKKVFLENTQDVYECELVLLDVPIYEENTREETGQVETKAFARRFGEGYENWLENLNEKDFIL